MLEESAELLPEIEYELTEFESLPYEFTGAYPNNWYYAGVRADSEEYMHTYYFDKEVIEEDGGAISLHVLKQTGDFSGAMEVHN